jgi:pyrroloquinoline quinone (PQQ) biosynthesis protein C
MSIDRSGQRSHRNVAGQAAGKQPKFPDRRTQDRRSAAGQDRRRPAIDSALPHPTAQGLAVQLLPADHQVERLLGERHLDALLLASPEHRHALLPRLVSLINPAFRQQDAAALGEIHRTLYLLYVQAFASPASAHAENHLHPVLMQARQTLEAAWEASLQASVGQDVDAALAAGLAFEPTFVDYCSGHRLARHPFFDFVEHEASREDLVQFFLHDSAIVLRFFDLLAMSMVGADEEIRGELVDNLWDEAGHRDPGARHTSLFRRLLGHVGVDERHVAAFQHQFHLRAGWQCLAGHNLYFLLGTRRRDYFRSLGCLGSAEAMDAAQYAKIVRGCRRLGWTDAEGLAYYTMHAEVDGAHGRGWLERVMTPLVGKYPNAARELLLGAAFRLETAAQYYDEHLRSMQRDAGTHVAAAAAGADASCLPT